MEQEIENYIVNNKTWEMNKNFEIETWINQKKVIIEIVDWYDSERNYFETTYDFLNEVELDELEEEKIREFIDDREWEE